MRPQSWFWFASAVVAASCASYDAQAVPAAAVSSPAPPAPAVAAPAVVVPAVPAPAAPSDEGTIPGNPRELTFPPIHFELPPAEDFRLELPSGPVLYFAEDHTLPLISLSVRVRTGGALDPAGKEGLAALTATMMRQGGTDTMTPEEFDEELDFLALQMGSGSGDTSASASMNCMAKDFDRALELFLGMLFHPRFDEDRLGIERDRILQGLGRRNDSTASIARREWSWLLFGHNDYPGRYSTRASIESIRRDDLVHFHDRWWFPSNMIVDSSGDISREELVAKLDAAFAAMASDQKPPERFHLGDFTPTPGVTMVAKEDVNQGRVYIGHRGTTFDDPNVVAIEIMNDILGGSGFTSRVTRRVRSDEGLAYSVGTRYSPGIYGPGSFAAVFQSKSETCALAAKIVLQEVNRIRDEGVTHEELDIAKNAALESFPGRFPDRAAVASRYAQDEAIGRPLDWWQTYREKVRAVTQEDVQRVARDYLDPSKLVVLVVGDLDVIRKGDDRRPASFDIFGAVHEVALPDPETLERPK